MSKTRLRIKARTFGAALVLWALCLCGASNVGFAARPATYTRAFLQSATLATEPGGIALTLGLSTAVKPQVFRLDHPQRLVVDLPYTRRGLSLVLPAAGGAVTAVRAAPFGRDAYRVVLELRASLGHAPQVSGPLSQHGGYSVRITVGETGAAAVAAPVAATVVPVGTAARIVRPVHSPGRLGRDVVVAIDAGHGGDDPGASGPAGTHEKDITLAVARTLAARLNDRSGMRAVLTRENDQFIKLRERMDRARAAHADLFVSIHADAVRDPAITGATVYTLSDRGASSEAAHWLADRENSADLKGGVSLADANQSLATVLLDLSQAATMGASVEAADQVLKSLDGVGAVRKRVVQHAAFVVLKSPDLPSMLVETAYISNPAEERNLRSKAYQARLARAIEAGVVAYFQRHPPDGTHYARARHPDSSEGDAAGDSGV